MQTHPWVQFLKSAERNQILAQDKNVISSHEGKSRLVYMKFRFKQVKAAQIHSFTRPPHCLIEIYLAEPSEFHKVMSRVLRL